MSHHLRNLTTTQPEAPPTIRESCHDFLHRVIQGTRHFTQVPHITQRIKRKYGPSNLVGRNLQQLGPEIRRQSEAKIRRRNSKRQSLQERWAAVGITPDLPVPKGWDPLVAKADAEARKRRAGSRQSNAVSNVRRLPLPESGRRVLVSLIPGRPEENRRRNALISADLIANHAMSEARLQYRTEQEVHPSSQVPDGTGSRQDPLPKTAVPRAASSEAHHAHQNYNQKMQHPASLIPERSQPKPRQKTPSVARVPSRRLRRALRKYKMHQLSPIPEESESDVVNHSEFLRPGKKPESPVRRKPVPGAVDASASQASFAVDHTIVARGREMFLTVVVTPPRQQRSYLEPSTSEATVLAES